MTPYSAVELLCFIVKRILALDNKSRMESFVLLEHKITSLDEQQCLCSSSSIHGKCIPPSKPTKCPLAS
jgi:hypothetical protein